MKPTPPIPALHSFRKINRRACLRIGMAAALASIGVARAENLWTPRQTEGPFYPVQPQADKDADLTHIEGRNGSAKGEVIHVQGRVLDTKGNPLRNAVVEIWQANTWGRYSHQRDPNPAPLDPDFQGWGQTTSGEDDRYGFKTILPGAYPAGPDWNRPPHIHFKVTKPGFQPLTTQMYFPGQALNRVDLILQNLPREQRAMVIATRLDNKPGEAPVFVFDIVLQAG